MHIYKDSSDHPLPQVLFCFQIAGTPNRLPISKLPAQLQELVVLKIVQWENVELNLDARRASVDGEDIGLTAHEYNVLAYLVERPGRAVSRRQLADYALPECGERYDRTVDSHVSRIPHKVGTAAAKRISTVWGVGYRFEES